MKAHLETAEIPSCAVPSTDLDATATIRALRATLAATEARLSERDAECKRLARDVVELGNALLAVNVEFAAIRWDLACWWDALAASRSMRWTLKLGLNPLFASRMATEFDATTADPRLIVDQLKWAYHSLSWDLFALPRLLSKLAERSLQQRALRRRTRAAPG